MDYLNEARDVGKAGLRTAAETVDRVETTLTGATDRLGDFSISGVDQSGTQENKHQAAGKTELIGDPDPRVMIEESGSVSTTVNTNGKPGIDIDPALYDPKKPGTKPVYHTMATTTKNDDPPAPTRPQEQVIAALQSAAQQNLIDTEYMTGLMKEITDCHQLMKSAEAGDPVTKMQMQGCFNQLVDKVDFHKVIGDKQTFCQMLQQQIDAFNRDPKNVESLKKVQKFFISKLFPCLDAYCQANSVETGLGELVYENLTERFPIELTGASWNDEVARIQQRLPLLEAQIDFEKLTPELLTQIPELKAEAEKCGQIGEAHCTANLIGRIDCGVVASILKIIVRDGKELCTQIRETVSEGKTLIELGLGLGNYTINRLLPTIRHLCEQQNGQNLEVLTSIQEMLVQANENQYEDKREAAATVADQLDITVVVDEGSTVLGLSKKHLMFGVVALLLILLAGFGWWFYRSRKAKDGLQFDVGDSSSVDAGFAQPVPMAAPPVPSAPLPPLLTQPLIGQPPVSPTPPLASAPQVQPVPPTTGLGTPL